MVDSRLFKELQADVKQALTLLFNCVFVRYTIYMNIDPTLQLENDTPEYGVPGKMLGNMESGWGVPFKNDPRNQFTSLDNSEESVIMLSEKEEVGMSKNLPNFYDPVPYEDRALVNPAELAQKLLAKVPYEKKYGADMLEFFLSKARSRRAIEIHYSKNGEMIEKEKDIPNAPPMFSEFGRTIGVSDKTIKGWTKKYPEFSEAYEICQDIIQEFFVENGVKGRYTSQFAIFAAKNLTKMKDVMVNKNENYDMKSILDAIEKGTSVNED